MCLPIAHPSKHMRPRSEHGVMRNLSLAFWVSQKSKPLGTGASVEVLAQALVYALGVKQLEGPVFISGHQKLPQQLSSFAAADHAFKDAILHWRMPEGLEVNGHWLVSPRFLGCVVGASVR